MAVSLPVQTSVIILGVIAGVYCCASVLLLVAICCVCYRKRKIRAVSPKKGYVSPQSSDGEHSTPGSPSRGSLASGVSSTAKEDKLPKRYRSKSKRKAEQTISCPEYEGARESPLLVRQRQAWSTENLNEDLVICNPATPDSGLASSLGDSKHDEVHSGRDSAESSHSGSNDDVFGDRNNSRSEEAKRDVRRRPPKPIRTESTTPLMDDNSNGLYTPGSEKEFDLKPVLPPIKEKTCSPDSLDGTFFANKSALSYSDEDKQQPYTELSSLPIQSLNIESLPSLGSRDVLPPIRGGSQGQLVGRMGRLPPLHPPGHSQENLHYLDEVSTEL